jgi:phage terminase large subunit-like protein
VQSWDTANKASELSDCSVCTTWGVKGNDLYLIAVFAGALNTQRSRAPCASSRSLFAATEVLLEDKASGTQLIQEVIVEGCHGVTRYEPTTEKIMRLHTRRPRLLRTALSTYRRRRRGSPNACTK